MRRFFLLFLILFFGCLATQKNKTYFEVFTNANETIHLERNAIFNYYEFSGINGSELSCRAISNVDLIKFNDEKIIKLNIQGDITPFSYYYFQTFLPYFNESKQMPNSAAVYKNITIFKINNNNSIGFFEKNNTLYIGKEGILQNMIDQIKGNLTSTYLQNTNGNVVYLTTKYPIFAGYATQMTVMSSIITSNITRMQVSVLLTRNKKLDTEISQYLDGTRLKNKYEVFFNSKPGLNAKSIEIIYLKETIEIKMEIIGDFNIFMRNIQYI